jgi:hypothetical protein
LAALGGHEACVQSLLQAGCEVDQLDGHNQTPLMLACHRKNFEVAVGFMILILLLSSSFFFFSLLCGWGGVD